MKRVGLVATLALIALASSILAAPEFDAAAATNRFGLDLYRQLAREQKDGNLVISPYSIESALALAYAGTDGATRAEMARVLGFPRANEDVQAGFARLRSSLQSMTMGSKKAAGPRIEWNVANRLYGQTGYAFRPDFLKLMNEGFAAPFEPCDFKTNPEAERDRINRWVANETRDRIEELIPKGRMGPATRLVLVNALYLKAPWQRPFDSKRTEPRPFHIPSGPAINVPTMSDTQYVGYTRDELFTMVTWPYTGRLLQFIIILPNPGESLETLANHLTPQRLADAARPGEKTDRMVALYLPKFKAAGDTQSLTSSLGQLGLRDAFGNRADFTGIAPRDPNQPLLLSEVLHQTYVDVNEKGTEAAAASAMMMSVGGAPRQPIEVHVNRRSCSRSSTSRAASASSSAASRIRVPPRAEAGAL